MVMLNRKSLRGIMGEDLDGAVVGANEGTKAVVGCGELMVYEVCGVGDCFVKKIIKAERLAREEVFEKFDWDVAEKKWYGLDEGFSNLFLANLLTVLGDEVRKVMLRIMSEKKKGEGNA